MRSIHPHKWHHEFVTGQDAFRARKLILTERSTPEHAGLVLIGNEVTRATSGAVPLARRAGGAVAGAYGADVSLRNVTFAAVPPSNVAFSCMIRTRGVKQLLDANVTNVTGAAEERFRCS